MGRSSEERLERFIDRMNAGATLVNLLEQALKFNQALFYQIQADAVEYLKPDGMDADWFIGRVLGVCDGLEQRMMQRLADAALKAAETHNLLTVNPGDIGGTEGGPVWHPMETAPKDGRDILIGKRSGKRWMVVAAHWTPYSTHYDNMPEYTGNWYVVLGNGKTVSDRYSQSCRWSPLPPPPEGW